MRADEIELSAAIAHELFEGTPVHEALAPMVALAARTEAPRPDELREVTQLARAA